MRTNLWEVLVIKDGIIIENEQYGLLSDAWKAQARLGKEYPNCLVKMDPIIGVKKYQ